MSKRSSVVVPADPVEQMENDLKRDGVPLLVSLQQVAIIARRSYSSCWREVAADKLVALKHGRKRLIRRRDLAAWLLGAN